MLRAGRQLLKKAGHCDATGGKQSGRRRSRSPLQQFRQRRSRSKSKSRENGFRGRSKSKSRDAAPATAGAASKNTPATGSSSNAAADAAATTPGPARSVQWASPAVVSPLTVGSSPGLSSDCIGTVGSSSSPYESKSNLYGTDNEEEGDDDNGETFLKMQMDHYNRIKHNFVRSASPERGFHDHRDRNSRNDDDDTCDEGSVAGSSLAESSLGRTSPDAPRLGISRPRYGAVEVRSEELDEQRQEEDEKAELPTTSNPLMGYMHGMAPKREKVEEEVRPRHRKKELRLFDDSDDVGGEVEIEAIAKDDEDTKILPAAASRSNNGKTTKEPSKAVKISTKIITSKVTSTRTSTIGGKAATTSNSAFEAVNISSSSGSNKVDAVSFAENRSPRGVKVPSMVQAIEKQGLGGAARIVSTADASHTPETEQQRRQRQFQPITTDHSPDRFLHRATAQDESVAGTNTTDVRKVMTGRSLGGGITVSPTKGAKESVAGSGNGAARGEGSTGIILHENSKNSASYKVFLLLLQPSKKIFELIQIEYDAISSTVGDILNLIKFHATEPILGRQRHVGLVRPRDGIELTDLSAMASAPGPKSARIKKGEVLVPLPEGCCGNECRRLAGTILKTPSLVKLLSREDPLAPKGKKNGRRMKKKGGSKPRSPAGSRKADRHPRTSTLVPVVEDEEHNGAIAVGAAVTTGQLQGGDERGKSGDNGSNSTPSTYEVEEFRRAALDAASTAAATVLEKRMSEIERRILRVGRREHRQNSTAYDADDNNSDDEDELIRVRIEKTIRDEAAARARQQLEERVRKDVEEKARARAEIEERLRREAEERIRDEMMTPAERIEQMAREAEEKNSVTSSRSVTPFSDSEGETTMCASPPGSLEENSPPTSPPKLKMTASSFSAEGKFVSTQRSLASEMSREEVGSEDDDGPSMGVIATETVASLLRDAAQVAKPRLRRLRNTMRKAKYEMMRRDNKPILAVSTASVAIATAYLLWLFNVGGFSSGETAGTSSALEEEQQQDPLGIFGVIMGASFLIFLVRFQTVAARKRSRAEPPPPPRRKGRKMVRGVAIRSVAPLAAADTHKPRRTPVAKL